MPRINIDYVFWDFDGIINRIYEDGRYGWCKHFERDLGVQFNSFSSSVSVISLTSFCAERLTFSTQLQSGVRQRRRRSRHKRSLTTGSIKMTASIPGCFVLYCG